MSREEANLKTLHDAWNKISNDNPGFLRKQRIMPNTPKMVSKVRQAVQFLPYTDMWVQAINELIEQMRASEWWLERISNPALKPGFDYMFIDRQRVGIINAVKYYEASEERKDQVKVDLENKQRFHEAFSFNEPEIREI